MATGVENVVLRETRRLGKIYNRVRAVEYLDAITALHSFNLPLLSNRTSTSRQELMSTMTESLEMLSNVPPKRTLSGRASIITSSLATRETPLPHTLRRSND